MTSQLSQPPDSASRYLRWAAILFAIGWGVHVSGPSAPRHVGVAPCRHGRRHDSGVVRRGRGRDGAHPTPTGTGSGDRGRLRQRRAFHLRAPVAELSFPAYQDSFVSGTAHQRDVVLLVQRRRRDRHRHRVRDRRHAGPPVRRRKARSCNCGSQRGGVPMNADSGHIVLRRSMWNVHALQGFTAEVRSNRQHADRAAAEPGSRGTAGHRAGEPAGFGPMAGFFGRGLFRRARPPTRHSQRRSAPESRWRSIGFPASASSRTSSIGGWSRTDTGSPGTTPYCESHPAAC